MENRRGQLLSSLLLLALTWWLMMPGHQRREYLMRTAHGTQKAARGLAVCCARYAMSEELAGDDVAARAGYGAAYRLMTGLYARAGRWYASI